jgi:hypothetical protein
MKPLHWSNTVRLTLSIQCSSELMVLLRDDALPIIEHLNITNEEVYTTLTFQHDKPISNIQLRENDLRSTAGSIRLRSLVIRYISLGDLIILIRSLNMSSLQQLILVDLYDNSKLSCDICLQFVVVCLES